MDRHKLIEPVDGKDLENDWQDFGNIGQNMWRTVREFQKQFPNFDICGMDVGAESTRPNI